MHFYWRIQQDLLCLGEFLIFKDPALIREYTAWAQKNAASLAMIEDFDLSAPLAASLN
jgi:hypothetical protein